MNFKPVLGLLLLIVVAGVVYMTQSGESLDILKQQEAPDAVTVQGYVGGEKMRFLANPDVQRILAERHGVTFDATKAGSIEMVTTLGTAGQNVLWPSNQVAVELFRLNGGQMAKDETLFNSPIVLYTWDLVADAMIQQGLFEERNGVLYAVDFPALVELILAGTEWKDVGVPQLFGKVKIFSTDPRRSNSGNMFSGLLANMMNGGDVVTEGDLDRLLPELVGYFDRMGYQESSSGDIFESFLKTGPGGKPIIVGYENQLIEFALEHEEYRDLLRQRIRTVYPVPTVWSSHPVIALDDAGKRLITALEDPEIQDLAWRQHGFRSGLVGFANDPSELPVGGLPATIDAVVPMPSAPVMQRIIDSL